MLLNKILIHRESIPYDSDHLRGLARLATARGLGVSGDAITGVNDLQTLAGTLFAIAIGMMVGRVLVGRRWDWIPKSVKG
jgi:hypothetical protein